MQTEETKKIYKIGYIALVVLTVFLAAEALGSLKELRGVDPSYNSISVNGEGESIYIPDVATFSFNVSADAKTVSAAQTQVTTKMNKILDALKAMGIDEKDIKTTNYSFYPKYTYTPTVCSPNYCPPSRQNLDGYTANHDVSVKVRNTEDADAAGKALTIAGDNGATNLSGISFTADDPNKARDEARSLAIEDAKERAEKLADELGVRLVRVVSYYDNNYGPMPYYAEGGVSMDMAKAQSAPMAPTLPTGENKVTANVTVIYEIR